MIKPSHKLTLLSPEAVGLMASLFTGKVEGFEDVYMIEVKLDDPLSHFRTGEGIIFHNDPSGEKRWAEHLFDDQWLVVQKSDPEWQFVNIPMAIQIAKQYVGKVTKEEQEKAANLVLTDGQVGQIVV